MNDMQQVQRAIMAFLKRLNSMYETTLKDELRQLYRRLKPLEHHPYERRTFYYLDILSWLESKLKGGPVAVRGAAAPLRLPRNFFASPPFRRCVFDGSGGRYGRAARADRRRGQTMKIKRIFSLFFRR